MTVLWIIVLSLVALLWVLSIVDVIRQRYGGWTTAGWLALIVILPILGPIIYGITRKPAQGEAEQQYLADADRRSSAAALPFDGTGIER